MTPPLLSADKAGAAGAFLMLLFIGSCLIGLAFYFLPSFIAAGRRKDDQTVGILLVNLFFCWAVLGWLGCLIWAIWYLIDDFGSREAPEVCIPSLHRGVGRVLPASVNEKISESVPHWRVPAARKLASRPGKVCLI
jgi:hypothetical protein